MTEGVCKARRAEIIKAGLLCHADFIKAKAEVSARILKCFGLCGSCLRRRNKAKKFSLAKPLPRGDLQVCEAPLQASPRRGRCRTKCDGEGFANAQAFAGVAETSETCRVILSIKLVATGRETTSPTLQYPFMPAIKCQHKPKAEMKNHPCFLFIKLAQTNNQSFFCLLFFPKKKRCIFQNVRKDREPPIIMRI